MPLNLFTPGLFGPLSRDKNTNSVFSIAGFLQTYVFKTPLFPSLSTAAVAWINNSKSGLAHSCAADDLELSLGNDQIELFDNYLAPQAKQPNHDSSNGYGLSSSLDAFSDGPQAWGFEFSSIPDLDSTPSLSLSYQTSMLSYPGTGFDNNFLDLHQRSHFALNMVGIHSQPPAFFNDFRRSPRPSVDSPMGGSTSESLVSFMDELFLKNGPLVPNTASGFASGYVESPPVAADEMSRKRKISESPGSSVLYLDPELDSYKKVKRESALDHDDIDRLNSISSRKDSFLQSRQNSIQNRKVSLDGEDKKEARHVCTECNATFKVKSYLTRHSRKHTNAMAFMCPFHDISAVDNFGNVIKSATKCHPTGGFSRRDTYKTHLKALHFIYPPGTKSSDRNSTGGRCAGCFEYFESNARWLKYHIECDQCKGLQENGRSVKGNGTKGQRNSQSLGSKETQALKTESFD